MLILTFLSVIKNNILQKFLRALTTFLSISFDIVDIVLFYFFLVDIIFGSEVTANLVYKRLD